MDPIPPLIMMEEVLHHHYTRPDPQRPDSEYVLPLLQNRAGGVRRSACTWRNLPNKSQTIPFDPTIPF